MFSTRTTVANVFLLAPFLANIKLAFKSMHFSNYLNGTLLYISKMALLSGTFFKNVTNILKVALFVATPFKSLAVFKHYLAISAQTSLDNHPSNRNRSYVRLFKLLFALQTYFILLNTGHLVLQSSISLELQNSRTFLCLHILTFDTVHLFHLPRSSFYLAYSFETLLAMYLVFLFYFRPNSLLNGRLEAGIYGRSKHEQRSMSPSVDAAAVSVAIRLTNTIEGFILLLGICMLLTFVHFTLVFTQHFQVPETAAANSFCLAAYFVVFFLHALHFIVSLYAFTYILCLAGTFGFVCLVYLFLFVQLNTKQIRRAVMRCQTSTNATVQLIKLLRTNITAFQMLFAGNAFFGTGFFAFLLINLPLNAFFTMMVLFGQRMDGLSFFVMSVFASHEVLGATLLHFGLARISRYVHSAGVLLVAYSAKSGLIVENNDQLTTTLKCKVKQSLLQKQKIAIWRHTMRLITTNRYGFTYGLIGAPVTMNTLTKV